MGNDLQPIISADVTEMIDVICKNDHTRCQENMILNTEAGPSHIKIDSSRRECKLESTDFFKTSEKVLRVKND